MSTPDVALSEEAEQARRLRLAECDRVAERLEQDDPGGAERFQAGIERKRAVNLRLSSEKRRRASRRKDGSCNDTEPSIPPWRLFWYQNATRGVKT